MKAHQIKVDVEKVQAKIRDMVSVFENPAEMAKRYYQNKDLLMQLQATILEEQTVDELLKTVQVVEREVSYSEMFKR